ncbi:MAG: PD40 domain-containing protein [Acidobacteria bacterium]|nr:PD40 domain-containing protein [Acidobacteriota bacterium]MBS1867685.1 PD40 domain-containing protein [Acidobacteriota bacterium]
MDDTQLNSSPSSPAARAGRKNLFIAFAVAIAVLAAGIAYSKFHSPLKGLNFEIAKPERLTQSGKATGAALSPDGKTVAYILNDQGAASLVLHPLQTGSDSQLVAPESVMFSGLSFSPDGNSVYYTASSKDNDLFSYLYKIPVQGGQPAKLVDDIDTSVSFSPDGQRFAFIRGVPGKGENHLIVANADGSGLQIIARRPGQVYHQSLITPAWSPDGKTIAFVNYQAPARRSLLTIAPDGSNLREIYSTHNYLGRPQWLRDGTGVVIPIREENIGERSQLWAIGYPAGQATKLTNDLTDYSTLWLNFDRDASSLVGIETVITGDLWILPGGDSSRASKISKDRSPVFFVTTLGKDHILYQTRDSGIFVANSDGSDPRQILASVPGVDDLSGCGDGRHILYGRVVGEESNVWRIDADGSNPTQLTREKSAVMPNCSPDGQWLFYWNEQERKLYKLPIDGGKPDNISLPNLSNPYTRISPDAKTVLYAGENPKGPTKPYLFSIANLANGTSSAQFEALPGMGMTVPQWDPQGHGFYLNMTRQGAPNIWKMETPGGPVKQITNFPSGLIASYAWSPDGKNLFVARATKTNDVILLTSPK